MSKTIGILGGWGPLATADLFRKNHLPDKGKLRQTTTSASNIDSNARIPDRTAAILLRAGRTPCRR